MFRKTDVSKHERTYKSGKTGSVSAHKRKIYYDPDKFEPLSDKWAKEFIKKRAYSTHPDTLNTSRIVFLYPNNLWAENPEKYDIYGLDCKEIPEYDKVPAWAFPYQIIKVKEKYYLGTDKGRFQRTFPPRALYHLNPPETVDYKKFRAKGKALT